MIPGNKFQDFTYSKRSHFEQFSRIGDYVAFDVDDCDLLPYQNLFAYNFIIDNLHPGAKILQIGEGYLPILDELKQDYECWSIECTSQGTQASDESKGYKVITDKIGDFSDQLADSYFDCVFSLSVLTKVPEEEKLHENIYQDINRVLKFGGVSLHLFDILVKQDNVWMNGMLSYILDKSKTLQHSVTSPTQIQADSDLYGMSKAAYEKMWQPAIQQTYEQFGQPVSYNVFWRKVQEGSDSSTTESKSSEKLGSQETATAYLRQSYNLQTLGKLDEAIAICQQAIKVNPDLSWGYHTLGDFLTEKGILDDAITSYRSAIKVNPNAAWSHYELGKCLEKKEQPEEAIAAYHNSIQSGLEYYGFYEALGRCLMRQGKIDQALAAYQQASQFNPSCEVPEALINLYTYTKYERASVNT